MGEFLMSLKGVTLAFGGPAVLDGVSLVVTRGMRAALTGRNGEGKSTLFKILAGVLEPDAGEIVRAPGLKVGFVSQEVEAAGALSGGQSRKRRLEEALLARPDVLLLDEPTNHLDVETIDWLEGMLRRQREMAVLVVTHDRRFLRRVATEIFDLDRGELAGWSCDYATFVKRKRELMADEAVYWARRSKKLAEEEAWIRRGVKARTTRNEGRVAALLKLREEFAARRATVGTATLRLDTAAPGGMRVLKVENLGFAWPGGRLIVRNFTADVLRGERIGILGRNGSGKTTLLKLLTGRLEPTEGSVTRGTGLRLAFLDQLRGELKDELSVKENLAPDRDEVTVGGVRRHVYAYLSDFLFTPERARTPVKALSGGEKARLLLARLFLKPSNLLVMDEPTNDLDVETLELLEEQLLNYKGTLLVVSHDRTFLDNVTTSCYVLAGDGVVRPCAGGYAEAARLLKQVRGDEAARSGKSAASPEDDSGTRHSCRVSDRPRKLTYKEQRELEALPERIAALEGEIAEIEAALGDPALYAKDAARVAALTARLGPAKEELDAAETLWLELSMR